MRPPRGWGRRDGSPLSVTRPRAPSSAPATVMQLRMTRHGRALGGPPISDGRLRGLLADPDWATRCGSRWRSVGGTAIQGTPSETGDRVRRAERLRPRPRLATTLGITGRAPRARPTGARSDWTEFGGTRRADFSTSVPVRPNAPTDPPVPERRVRRSHWAGRPRPVVDLKATVTDPIQATSCGSTSRPRPVDSAFTNIRVGSGAPVGTEAWPRPPWLVERQHALSLAGACRGSDRGAPAPGHRSARTWKRSRISGSPSP